MSCRSSLRLIRSEINSGSQFPPLYFYSKDYTSIYLQDTNLITIKTPIYFYSTYNGTFDVNLADANQWIYSPDTNDWHTPSDLNIHIVDANYPPQYFLITDLNDVAGGGTINVICDFNTSITPEECATLYVRKP